ncbi:hypothetical protein AC249_AIPGENE6788 [Exaiptasia diaphana]|nr:hypothetical protein AC249_AIPGENE6788 [Exaiptasia diaphana]
MYLSPHPSMSTVAVKYINSSLFRQSLNFVVVSVNHCQRASRARRQHHRADARKGYGERSSIRCNVM